MGQGCLSVPNVQKSRRTSRSRSSSGTGSGHQTAPSQALTQLCSHNVCSVLRNKDWAAAEEMVRTNQGVDITWTKFLERALYEGCPTHILEALLKNGANPLESTRCLSDAILGRVEYKIVKRLLDMGCSPNQQSEQDRLRRTPMHFACQTGTSLEIVEVLLERGGDLNNPVGERLWTPLHYLACANHDSVMLRKLVLKGGDINARASDGTTPMAVAAFKRAPLEFFRTMLELGGDPSITTRLFRNPLYYIRYNNEMPALDLNDLRLVLLDPKIHFKQVFALLLGLHKRVGKNSQVSRLNSDLIINIAQFIWPNMPPSSYFAFDRKAVVERLNLEEMLKTARVSHNRFPHSLY